MRVRLMIVLGLCAALLGCATSDNGTAAVGEAPARLRAQVLAVLPHDRSAYTQGLELSDGVLYEGTGLVGRSELRATDPATGTPTRRVALPEPLFGEGITVVGATIWQLTWENGIAIQRDKASLAELRRVHYSGEGWGLCHDAAGRRLVASDGSDRLTFRDPQTFQPVGEVRVRAAGEPVRRLNELECAHGSVFANVYQTDTIVRIDPASGRVTASIDLAGLLGPDERAGLEAGNDVLNGIAAIPGTDEFLVTGKRWPKMFRVRFVTER